MTELIIGVALGAGIATSLAVLRLRRLSARMRDEAMRARTDAASSAARASDMQREAGRAEEILAAMHDAVLLVEGSRLAYANPAARALFGDIDTLPPGIDSPVGGVGVQDLDLHHPVLRHLRVASHVLDDGRMLVVASDVTEARRLDATRRDFVANASHELKTPVAAIFATAQTLQSAIAEDPTAAMRFAHALEREADKLSAMVQDLLDLARLEQAVDHGDLIDLARIAADAVATARGAADPKKITLTADLSDAVARGRSEDLSLMVRNLLDNAVRYTPEGGNVWVHLGTSGDTIVLTVRDDGIGIPEKDEPRVFERFYRVDKARARQTGGTGLGLAIVRHVAESHGGSVAVRSELGAGSTFTVTLPVATQSG